MFYLTNETLPVFVPLGFIGVIRWMVFMFKIMAWFLYRPMKPRQHPRYKSKDVTIVVPTIDAGPEISKALESWVATRPHEIIFVTVPSVVSEIETLTKSVNCGDCKVKVITVPVANKRSQMVAGVSRVNTQITVFCDDDVIWPVTMLTWLVSPFEHKKMGGVGTSQTVVNVGKYATIWEIFAGFRLSMRNIEIVASTYIDSGVGCLSGRTAAYRTSILHDPRFQREFCNEFWMKKYHQHSGDDKFLTRWLHSNKYDTYIQACPEAELQSTFKNNWRFLKQLTRWTRNTWRSDFKSLFIERQIWARHPWVVMTMLDKMINPLTLLAGPATVAYLCLSNKSELSYQIILISYAVWLFMSRLLKYIPHFVRRPQDVFVIPLWILFNFYFAFLKIYCLFTLHVTGWGTRETPMPLV